MQNKLPTFGVALMWLALAAGCAPDAIAPPPAEVPVAVTHAIARPASATDAPAALLRQAEAASGGEATSLRLSALAGFIGQGDLRTAAALIGRLRGVPMTGFQNQLLLLQRARLAQAEARHEDAIVTLRELARRRTPDAIGGAALLLMLADSQRVLGATDEALLTLLQRDRVLPAAARIANQQRIFDLLDEIDSLHRLLLRERADPEIDGWLALHEILRAALPGERATRLRQWRTRRPAHLAAAHWLRQPIIATTRYRHIALLLPLTSRFGTAAQAFYTGFTAAHDANRAADRPRISIRDVGATPALTTSYYAAAVAAEADFVVGPFGREAVDALLAGPPPSLPTLVIGDIPADKTAPNLYGISLSPEREARQVAVRAFADGHRQAGIVRTESNWGRRVAAAFAEQWEALGGHVAEQRAFSPTVSDHSPAIRQLLGLRRSIARHRVLRADLGELGVDLEFTPRRRDDLDFLFLAASADQARLLAPQLRFFQAHDLALYATSYVFSGKPDPGNDADLDGILFGDMEWMLDAVARPPPVILPPETALANDPAGAAATAATTEPPTILLPAIRGPLSSPYYHSEFDRLYALGLESYRLIPALAALRNKQWQRYLGSAVSISLQADGNALRHLTWARFEHGLPIPRSHQIPPPDQETPPEPPTAPAE